VSANISTLTTIIRQLDSKKQPDEVVKPVDVEDSTKLAQLLQRVLRRQTEIERKWMPRHIDFEDKVCTGSDVAPEAIRLTHMFNGPVRWWVVAYKSGGTVALPYIQEAVDANAIPLSDLNTLVLSVYFEGTITVRVQEAGA
jgi:hypothetical protein